jgi:hypothetical protein
MKTLLTYMRNHGIYFSSEMRRGEKEHAGMKDKWTRQKERKIK